MSVLRGPQLLAREEDLRWQQRTINLADVDPFSARIYQFQRMLAEHFTTCIPFKAFAVTSGSFEISRQDLPGESIFAGFNTQFSLQQNSV